MSCYKQCSFFFALPVGLHTVLQSNTVVGSTSLSKSTVLDICSACHFHSLYKGTAYFIVFFSVYETEWLHSWNKMDIGDITNITASSPGFTHDEAFFSSVQDGVSKLFRINLTTGEMSYLFEKILEC